MNSTVCNCMFVVSRLTANYSWNLTVTTIQSCCSNFTAISAECSHPAAFAVCHLTGQQGVTHFSWSSPQKHRPVLTLTCHSVWVILHNGSPALSVSLTAGLTVTVYLLFCFTSARCSTWRIDLPWEVPLIARRSGPKIFLSKNNLPVLNPSWPDCTEGPWRI